MTAPLPSSVLAGNLPVRAFLRAFPFYLAWNGDGVIVEAGPSLRKIYPHAEPGARIEDVFRLVRPRGELAPAFFHANADQLFILEGRLNLRLLRGGFFPLDGSEVAVFLGTPWLRDTDELSSYGLTLADFAVHDQTLDLLLLLQTQKSAANDLRHLNARLVEKRSQLIEKEAQARKLALVASSTDNAVILTDSDMRLEWVNDAFTRVTGWTFEEIGGRRLWDFLAASAPEAVSFDAAAACLEAGKVYRKELLQRRRDGRHYWLSIEVQSLPDDAREVASLMVIGRDVTERKAAVEALRRSELEARSQRDEARRQHDELDWIYNTAPIGICLFDRDLRYRRVNRWLAEINGASIDAHIGKSVWEVAPGVAARVEKEAQNVIRTARPARFEDVTGETAAQPGIIRYFNESWFPAFDERGEVAGLTLLVEEITDQRRVRVLKEADRRKNEFLATLAHELRNPLAPIKSALQMVQMNESFDPEICAENQAALRIAERQVDHLTRLVDDLLEVARITHGKIELKREPTDLLAILPQAVDLVRPQLERKGHVLIYEAPAEPLPVSCDKVRLVQVFANLLDNAIKYTPAGGAVRLSAGREGEMAVVRVADNGQGIPPEKLSSIWDLFAQVEYNTPEAKAGIGIGLALARNLVELHGGHVSAASQGAGRGAEFRVAIPLAASLKS
jgi:PAS domain S-box-containing protein